MNTTSTHNGHAAYDADPDWQAAYDYALDHERFPRDQRTPCRNADCPVFCESLFCSERCREASEGPDHEPAFELEEHTPTAETSGTDRRNFGVVDTSESMMLPEAPASANVFVTLKGRQVQLTLRDTSETRLLHRLSVVLDQFPLETPAQASTLQATPQAPTCKWHGAMKESTKAPGTWYCPGKMGDGTYCKERHHA
jgi:hypothetical protein